MNRLLPYTRAFQVHKSLQRFQSTKAGPGYSPNLFSVFTVPNDSKRAILGALDQRLGPSTKTPTLGADKVPAAIVLASPRHASWLSDVDFMAEVVRHLRRRYVKQEKEAIATQFHLLAAVVDALPSATPDGSPQEGLSFATGYSDKMFRGELWKDTLESAPDMAASSVSFRVHVRDPYEEQGGTIKTREEDFCLTLPLANTLFLNGRRSTLLASAWDITPSTEQEKLADIQLSRMEEKRTQTVVMPKPQSSPLSLSIQCHLTPIGEPRIVRHVLGNIVSRIDIDGQLSPASEELQREIPRLLGKGPVSVWALIFPGRCTQAPNTTADVSPKDAQRVHSEYNQLIERLKAESPNQIESPFLPPVGAMLRSGCRLFRILSGGGEWGAKASLLSLDPQVEYESPSDADSLESFKNAFQGDLNAADAIVRPGDLIQFYIVPAESRQESKVNSAMQWGVGGLNQESELGEKQLLQQRSDATPLLQAPFGGYSTESVFLSSSTLGVKTKVDVPNSNVGISWLEDQVEGSILSGKGATSDSTNKL